MSEQCTCSRCRPLERVRFYPRQLVTAQDLNDEEEYVLAKLRRHNAYLHGFGIVCGLGVTVAETGFVISVEPGYALSPSGDEVCVAEGFEWDLRERLFEELPCPPQSITELDGKTLYVGVRPLDCPTRPLRVSADRCSCDEGRCEFSRIRETFECCVSSRLPEAYSERERLLAEWQVKVTEMKKVFAPPCLPCVDDNCVIIAQLTASGGAFVQGNVQDFLLRPPAVYSVTGNG